MKKFKIAGLLAVGLATIWSPLAMAWGPERETYTMEVPAMHATFNSIVDNPAVGDERDFVRIAENNGTYSNKVKLEDGKVYMIYIFFHNNAASNTNESGAGISKNTRVMSTFPDKISAGETKDVAAIIASDTATPAEVWDEAQVTADEDLTIEYIANTAIVHNSWALDGTKLSDDLFYEGGVPIGVDKADGNVLGCTEYSGYVIYRIRAYKEGTPPPPPPEELPKTGPAEIVMATAIVLGICVGTFYLYRTKRTLKKVTAGVMNESADLDNGESTKTNEDKHDGVNDGERK